MRRFAPLAVLSLSLVTSAPAARGATPDAPVAFVTVQAGAEIAATPAAVWGYIVSGRNMATWCSEWKTAANTSRTLTRVGDVLDYTDSWGHGGRSAIRSGVGKH